MFAKTSRVSAAARCIVLQMTHKAALPAAGAWGRERLKVLWTGLVA